MRIAIVIEKFDPAAGGNERSTEQIARRLIQRGHEVTILAAGGDADALPGATLKIAPWFSAKTSVGLWLFMRWTQRQLKRGGFDVSVSMTNAVPADVIELRNGTERESLARRLAMKPAGLRRELKRITMLTRPKTLLLLAADRRTLHSGRVRRIVAISHYVADQLFHHYTIRSKRVAMIANAAEIRHEEPEHRYALRQRTRRELGFNEDDVVFLFPAMDPARKGLPQLLEAMRLVHGDHPRIKLIVAGPSPRVVAASDDELRGAVRWIGPTRQMDALYAASEVTVLPTWCDPSSKVVLESLLHGVPAISTLYNGSSQWIYSPSGEQQVPSPFEAQTQKLIEGEAGYVIADPRDADALAEAMVKLCDADRRAKYSASTVGLHDKISMDRHVDQLEALLRELTEKQ